MRKVLGVHRDCKGAGHSLDKLALWVIRDPGHSPPGASVEQGFEIKLQKKRKEKE